MIFIVDLFKQNKKRMVLLRCRLRVMWVGSAGLVNRFYFYALPLPLAPYTFYVTIITSAVDR